MFSTVDVFNSRCFQPTLVDVLDSLCYKTRCSGSRFSGNRCFGATRMNTYDFEIIYQKGSEMPADYLSRNVVDSIQIRDGQMEKAQDAKEWISEIKKWMLNGTLVINANAKRYLNYYWANRFFIEDNLLWVRIQYRGESLRVCVVLPSTEINRVLKDGHGTLFSAHKGVAKQGTELHKTTGGLPWTETLESSSNHVVNVKKPEPTFIQSQIFELLCRFVLNQIKEYMQICLELSQPQRRTKSIFCVKLMHSQNTWN
jgi:hypothetical protein